MIDLNLHVTNKKYFNVPTFLFTWCPWLRQAASLITRAIILTSFVYTQLYTHWQFFVCARLLCGQQHKK